MQTMSIASTARSRGMSLLELTVAVAVGFIAAAAIFGTMIFQQKSYLLQLDYAEVQQNARVALDVLRTHIRQAGWGFAFDSDQGGAIGIGACWSNDNVIDEQQSCDSVDGGSDRLRLSHAEHEGFAFEFNGGPTDTPLAMTEGGTVTVADVPEHPIYDGLGPRAAVITGACEPPVGAGPTTAVDLVRLTAYAEVGASHQYTYDKLHAGAAAFACPNQTYAKAASFGLAKIIDLYIDRTDASHPKLQMRRIEDPDAPREFLIAEDIDDLQLQYGIDTGDGFGPDTDHVADIWCDDPSGGTAACETGFAARENFARIVAVRVAVVARTRKPVNIDGYKAPALQVQNHNIAGGDGYRRWIYRTTIALRNNEI